MKKAIMMVTLLASVLCCVDTYAGEGELHGTLDLSYVSRYIWRGYDAYPDNNGAYQPTLDLDLWQTGFGLTVFWSRADVSGFENSEWLSYTAYYKGMAFEEEAYATAYKTGYTYFSFPDEPVEGSAATRGSNGHAQELFAGFAWPKIFGHGLVPGYAMFAYWSAASDSYNASNSGWAHVFSLDYDLMLPNLFGGEDDQPIHFQALTVYNDGVGPAGDAADHDFSHGLLSVSAPFELSQDLTFIPAFNYQNTWNDTINTQDETWYSLTLRYSF